mgnify:CR=1 FL=1
MDTGCKIIFGRHEDTVTHGGEKAVFGNAFDGYQASIRHRFRVPYRLQRIMHYFGIGPEGPLKAHLTIVNRYVSEIVTQLQAGVYESSDKNLVAQFIADARKRYTRVTYLGELHLQRLYV